MIKSRTHTSYYRIPLYKININFRRWRNWLSIVAKLYSIK
uniref:Uncharacterized protein n=1 Tax=Podoviridae sp. ct8Lf7 TaxID=2827723 RepID=A0A8S5S144_9CAUD|nr:MAG TPA: hypothetical protein [Podoviridae sp. ct8Lf7]